ncbi:MAG: N-glycosylase/DNA lyase [Candidatus Altiarchaeota archaeon]
MDALVTEIRRLRKGEIRDVINARMKEFAEAGCMPIKEVFKELCFCVMTANCGAQKCWSVQSEVGDGFLDLSEADLEKKLRACGYRYPNRADYVVKSRERLGDLDSALKSLSGDELRDWVVVNVKGLGMKEASHFLRNIGFPDYAIIDFHIIDLLVKEGLIEKPKTLGRKKYLKIEAVLRDLAVELDLSLAELDLYLWYLETGKILK